MKKVFIVLTCILTMVAFVSSAWAIDRAPKKDSSDKKKESTESKKQIKEGTKAKLKSRASSLSKKTIRSGESKQRVAPGESRKSEKGSESKQSEEKYDYFMDRNNNGIDDRLEKDVKAKGRRKADDRLEKNAKAKSIRKEEVTKKKPALPSKKTPPKIKPVDKTSKGVKGTDVKQQKKEPKPKQTGKKKSKSR